METAACAVYGVSGRPFLLHLLPNVSHRWVDVLPGVLLAALGTAALSLAWPVVGRYVTGGAALSHAVFAFTAAAAGYVFILAEPIVASLTLNATLYAQQREQAATRPATMVLPSGVRRPDADTAVQVGE